MSKKKVDFKDFEKARLKHIDHIRSVLDSEFEYIAGFKAGHIVDIDFEVSKDGKVGVRMDNNFGVVGGVDAITFAEALELAARIANDFEYLGYEVCW